MRILPGDCVEVMAGMEPESVDAIVTDPPYDLTSGKRGGTGAASVNLDSPYGRARIGTGNGSGGFMGKAWDSTGVAFNPATWREALRVLKPGGYLLAFGGTRTFHRLACAIEDAGFEIRDCLSWMYASGFPKSLDVSKAIDKAAGATREVVGSDDRRGAFDGAVRSSKGHSNEYGSITNKGLVDRSLPATAAAEHWQGWGTSLKPAWEPIIMARKPLIGTVAANVLKYGTGAINVDASRIGTEGEAIRAPQSDPAKRGGVVGTDLGISRADREKFQQAQRESAGRTAALGRWPANVVLDEEAAVLLDEMSGERASGSAHVLRRGGTTGKGMGYASSAAGNVLDATYGDTGGAGRFFFTAKASSAERSAGLGTRNTHPTVKPVSLMSWLVRMVTPPGGTVLDPFLGSGSTAVAAAGCGFDWIGIERDPEYVAIAEQRLGLFGLREVVE